MYWPVGNVKVLGAYNASGGLPNRVIFHMAEICREDGAFTELVAYYDNSGRMITVNGVARDRAGAVIDALYPAALVLRMDDDGDDDGNDDGSSDDSDSDQ